MQDHSTTLILTVSSDGSGQRLDKWLTSHPDVAFSRSRIQDLITQGHVLLGDQQINNKNRHVSPGETYQIYVPEVQPALPISENIPLDILYHDADLAVINKPPGLTVHPAPGHQQGTLVNALLHHFAGELSGIGGVARPGILHRLDKDTSGILVIAKNDQTHRHLSKMFAHHDLTRRYIALVRTVPNPKTGQINAHIARSAHDRKKMAVCRDHKGKQAITDYSVVEEFGQLKNRAITLRAVSLVECVLHTGRTHQIRVHLNSIGHPVIGDPLYGPKKTIRLRNTDRNSQNAETLLNQFDRQALHAQHLSFKHPTNGKLMEFTLPPPADFQKLIDTLKKI